DKLKRYGDLLLANLTSARVCGGVVTVKDYYDPNQPDIQIEIPQDQTLQQAATGYYERYQKATRALRTLSCRPQEIGNQISRTEELLAASGQTSDMQAIEEIEARSGLMRQFRARPGGGVHSTKSETRAGHGKGRRSRATETGRRFLSTDGYEIVVGRN